MDKENYFTFVKSTWSIEENHQNKPRTKGAFKD